MALVSKNPFSGYPPIYWWGYEYLAKEETLKSVKINRADLRPDYTWHRFLISQDIEVKSSIDFWNFDLPEMKVIRK